jgi:hypothetical protein
MARRKNPAGLEKPKAGVRVYSSRFADVWTNAPGKRDYAEPKARDLRLMS